MDPVEQKGTPPDGVDAQTGEVEAQARPFSQFLIEQRRGALHGELSDALRELAAAVQDHGKGGTLTLTVAIKPGAKGTRTLVVTDAVKVKAPVGDRPAALFFADAAGNLHRDDPSQPELPLRTVTPAAPADLRVAGDGGEQA